MYDSIDILLATYQGAAYLEEQLASIFAQNYPHFHLWIRDDGSTDGTVALLEQVARTFPQQVTVLPGGKNIGILQNFSVLLQASKAPYVCFADQDDKWLPNKLMLSWEKMKDLENQYGLKSPLLVHTDLTVVNKDLKVIHPSFWRYTNLNPSLTSLNRVLTQNGLTGCTMMMNRLLVDLALPIPLQAIMHDWWMALVASCFGYIGVIDHPTLLYRQHGQNDTGAKEHGIKKYLTQTKREKDKKDCCKQRTHLQAQLLLERYSSLLTTSSRQLLAAYATLDQLSYFKQRQQIFKYCFFKHGFLRNVKALIAKA